jgi:hypothetical protein
MMKSMHASQHYPRKDCNSAVVDGIEALPSTSSSGSTVVRLARGFIQENLAGDRPAPAKGLLIGAGLSVMLWCFIVLASYGFITLVQSTLAG